MCKLQGAPEPVWEGKNSKYFSDEGDSIWGIPLYAKDNCPPDIREEYEIWKGIAAAHITMFGENAIICDGLF